jgi:hypothetical protein
MLPIPTRPEGASGSGVLCRYGGGITSIAIPGAPELVYAFAPDGLRAVAWTEQYRVAFVDANGDTVRVVEHDRLPPPLTDAEWEEAMRPFHELREERPDANCEPRAPVRPSAKGTLRHILFDVEGRMWVEALTPDGAVWDVFGADGRLIASASAPERHPGIPPYVRGDRLLQVETDHLGVQYVGVHRLTIP